MLTCIKGGGACLTQEKIVASCAKKFVVVADDRYPVYHSCIIFIPYLAVCKISYIAVLNIKTALQYMYFYMECNVYY